MKNYKVTWSIIFILLVVVGAFSYKFTVGSVEKSDDGRTSVILTKDERNALLNEMRTWLGTTQAILAAVSADNFEEAADVASKSGMAAEAETPGSLFRKLPIAMKSLGFDTRKKFDDIAADALQFRDSRRTIGQVSKAMTNCMACHSTYRFPEASK